MQSFVFYFLMCSITMSAISVLFIVASPILSNIYSAKWQYYAWLIVIIGFIIPFRPDFSFKILTVSLPVSGVEDNIANTPLKNATEKEIAVSLKILDSPNILQLNIPNTSETGSWYETAFQIWISVASFVFIYNMLKHYRLLTMINRWKDDITDKQILEILQKQKKELGIKESIHIKCCPLVTGSALVGLMKPTILLQTTIYSYEELSFIIRHELIHFKRKDLFIKVLLIIVKAIHWFNPIVYLVERAVTSQCEKSCDDAVIGDADLLIRKKYALLITSIAKARMEIHTPLATSFYDTKYSLKNRVLSIMDKGKKKAGVIVMVFVFIFTICTNIVVAANVSSNNIVTLKPASGYKITYTEVANESTSGVKSIIYSLTSNYTKEIIRLTWQTEEDYSDMEWWTAEEYQTWLDEHEITLEPEKGPHAWNFVDGSYVPIRDKSYDTNEFHKFLFNSIRNGLPIAKSVSDSNYFVISHLNYHNSNNPWYPWYSYASAIKPANGEIMFVDALSLDTCENMYLLVADKFKSKKNKGNLTNEEYTNMLATAYIPVEWLTLWE